LSQKLWRHHRHSPTRSHLRSTSLKQIRWDGFWIMRLLYHRLLTRIGHQRIIRRTITAQMKVLLSTWLSRNLQGKETPHGRIFRCLDKPVLRAVWERNLRCLTVVGNSPCMLGGYSTTRPRDVPSMDFIFTDGTLSCGFLIGVVLTRTNLSTSTQMLTEFYVSLPATL
jgi:hypothetical protein